MKILFDARWINTSSPDGITRYSRELITELSKLGDDLTLLISSEKQLKGLPKLKSVHTKPPTHYSEINQARRLNKHGFDVVYTPHYLFGGAGREFKLIRTVLDLIPFHHKNKQSKLVWKVFHSNMYFLKKLINDSDALVTISETVKKQLQKYTKLQISVILCAPTSLQPNRNKTAKKLLYIGRYEPYKNVETLIRTMKQLPEYELILAGNCPPERKKILSSMIPDKAQVRFVGVISDKDYQDKLNTVFAMVNASKEEGFGLQLVESMSVGCPVVCSDIDIFKEIVGASGLYFGSMDSSKLAYNIRHLEDTKNWQKLSAESIKVSKRYNWSDSARKLHRFCKEISSHS
jgi:glycosyltransferase involved in cell wall biosynthesis